MSYIYDLTDTWDDGSWLGDCCISKKRREGEIVVTKYIEE